jgi:HEAT repeat protein
MRITKGEEKMGFLDGIRIKSSVKSLAEPNKRDSAIETLVKIGESAVEPLLGALGDENLYVRRSAARALGQISDARAVESLIQALNDKDSQIRNEAAIALGKIRDERAIQPLVRAQLRWGAGGFNTEIESALAAFGKSATASLVQGLRSKHWHARLNAASALQSLGWTPRSEAQKIAYLIAQKSFNGLARMGDPAIEPLVKILRNQSEDDDIRMKAAGALGKIKGERVIEPLIQVLRDKHGGVRNHAAIALGETRDTRAVEPLIQALKHGEDHTGTGGIRKYAAEALGKIGDERAIGALRLALQDSNIYVREAAEFALERMSPDSRWAKMLEALKVLKPSSEETIERMRSRNVTWKTFFDPKEVVRDIQDEYESYTRITNMSQGQTSIELMFDNYVQLGGDVAPATRELQITIVADGHVFNVFYTGRFI